METKTQQNNILDFDTKKHEKVFKESDKGVRFHYWYQGKTTKHAHDFFEVFIIVQGKIKHMYNGKTDILEENTVCLIKPGDVHQFTLLNDSTATQFNITVTPSVFQNLCAALNESLYGKLLEAEKLILYRLQNEEFAHCSHLLNLLQAANSETDAYIHSTILKTLLSNFLLYFQSSLMKKSIFPEWFTDFLNKVHSPEYFLQPIHNLYALVPYSQPRLNSYFHQFMGSTLVAYITKLKINYSCNLLRHSNYSILQIAEQSGYNNLSHFNHTFKKQIGMSPKTYRQRYNK